MRTTIQLSKALAKIQDEALERMKSFFKGKPYTRIIIDKGRFLTIPTGSGNGTVTEIHSNGDVIYSSRQQLIIASPKYSHYLSADALLTILDELERMKKHNQLKKP